MDYKERIKQKRQQQASTQSRDELLSQLKEIQLASLMGNNQKPSIVLTDSTDLGEHISKLGNKIVEVLEAVKDDKSTVEQIGHITKLMGEFRSLVDTVQQSNTEQADRIISAVNDLKAIISDQKPIVVPAPNVRLTEKVTDFSPLIKELKTIFAPAKVAKQGINLNEYRAIDLDNASDGVQYVGFQDSRGNWYILQNDDRNNTIRYYFGKESYAQAWDEKYGHNYKTLSEAMK